MILQPPAVLLAGPSGSGKTSAIATALNNGLEVFALITEPGGVESLLDSAERIKAPIDKLHWASALPASAGWAGLEDMLTKVNTMDQKGLADIKDLGKAGFKDAAMRLLKQIQNFQCERTGKDFGDVTKWDDTRLFALDSLTGLSVLAWGATVGYKPTANPGEWGIAQNVVHNLLMKINADRRCFFCMTAHVEKEMDEMVGVKRLMVSTIGAKLAPKIPPFFSEVVKTARVMDTKNGTASFEWSTLAADMDLKNRSLPMNAKLVADFKPVVEAYRRRKQLATGATTASAPAPIAAKPNVVPAAPLTPMAVKK